MPLDGTPQSNSVRLVNNMEVLLATPNRWCQKSYLNYDDESASYVSFCLYGALDYLTRKASRQDNNTVGQAMADEAIARHCFSVVEFNDAKTTTHADILDFLHHVRRRIIAKGE